MKLNFDLNNSVEKTEIVLGKKNYDKFGSLTNVINLVYDYNLMSAKSISFNVHKTLNNQDERLWNQIRDRRLVWVKEYDEWFQISVNVNEENEITKEVTGITLCEAELGQINVNSTEINTENDIAREDYKNPTVFYKPSEPKESLLHRILKKAPNYSIEHVDLSLWNIQRTFSFNGSTIYDVLTGEIAQEIGCLFLFDSRKRSISVYDLQTNCLKCGHRGNFTDVCSECGGTNLDYGYGYDTSILIDSENLAQNITLTGKQDEVKNYIKVCGGDDVINTAISACNPNGTQYIFAFSNEDKEDMSDELSSKLDEYLKEYDRLTPTYKEIMLNVYNKINEQLELEHNMMPDIEQAETNAELELSKLTKASLSPIAVEDVSDASIYTVNNAVLGMAKCIVNSTVYKIDIIKDSSSFNNQVWKGKFRLENYSDEEDFAENTGYIEVNVNDDKEEYIKQKIQKTIDRDDVYLVDIFDVKTDLNVFTEELKKYSLSRLKSFESAYQSVIDVMLKANISNDSTYGNLYDELYIPYFKKLTAIKSEYKVREAQLKLVASELETLEKSSTEITSYLNFENYLGEELWKELCAFRREDVYENSNYVSDGLDDPEILKKAQELLDKARNQLITSSTTQWSLSATLYNLLAMPEFQKLTGMFNGGNWIRIKIDDKIYRLRLVHYSISDNDIQNLEVEFSDVTQTSNGVNDVNSLMSKVQSMATNFSAIVHQAEQGEKSFTELDKIRNDGLNVALYNISNSINQDFIIDEHGITGRMWDDILGTFAPEQVKINHNTIVWTDDYWQTAKCALGKIEYYNPILKTNVKQYGLIADAVIAGILMGNDIIGGDIYSENYSSTTGTHIDLNNGDFSFAGGKLIYNTTDNLLTLQGKVIANEGGEIGGWTIDANKIYMLDSGMSSSADYYAFWAGETNGKNGLSSTSNAKFSVSHDGKLKATDAHIEGKIITSSGELAGWNISENAIYKDIGDYRTYIQSPMNSNSWVFSTQKKSETGGGYVGQTYITASGLLYSKNANIIGGKIGGWTIENNYLVAETDTGTAPGTLNRVFLQPFNKENYEETWIISSQYEDIDSAGQLSGDSYPYWYITGGGDFITDGHICADEYIQTPIIYTDGASIHGKTSIYNEGLELYHQTPYIDFHFGYTDGAITGEDHTARIQENSSGALTVYNSISNASDRRLKQDISDLDKKYLNVLNLFKPVSYRFIKGSDNLYLGFIAQDIKQALIDNGITDLPLISQDNNGIYALDYNQITTLNTLGYLNHEERIKQLENDLLEANAIIQILLNK